MTPSDAFILLSVVAAMCAAGGFFCLIAIAVDRHLRETARLEYEFAVHMDWLERAR